MDAITIQPSVIRAQGVLKAMRTSQKTENREAGLINGKLP